MKKIFLSLFICISFSAFSNDPEVYPSHWWVGMKMNKIQLMIHGDRIGETIPQLKLPAGGKKIADGITLKGMHHAENPNYVFLDIEISKDAKPGIRKIDLGVPGSAKIAFELKARRAGNGTSFAQGVTSKDLVYLLMPDRFSNGDPSNDRMAGMRDQTLNRDSIYHRHGGDLQGVVNHLDYLKDLGVTSVWMTPVVENDMPNRTEPRSQEAYN